MKSMAHRPADHKREAVVIYLIVILFVLILALDPQVIHFEDDSFRLTLRGCFAILRGPFAGVYCE